MKKFTSPKMSVQLLEAEEIMRTSGKCFEIFACEDCYCTAVTCGDTYVCDGLKCRTLSDYD